MRPYVVRRTVTNDGKILKHNQPHVVRRVVSERTARLLASILQNVTEDEGTGSNARIEGFEVAGKTGTAQKPDLINGGYAADKWVASFIGFAPVEDPRVVVLVSIDEPSIDVHGGVVAAPAFRTIAQGALRHLGVGPEKPTTQFAKGYLAKRTNGAPRQKNRTTRKVQVNAFAVPDLTGLSLREAMTKVRGLNLHVEAYGHGYVVKQSLAPGSSLREKGILILHLNG